MEQHPKDPYAPEPQAENDGDDFPDLECAVCFSQFNNVFNTPKMLQCRHTFCLECLARMNIKSSQPETIQCPLCRAYTQVPSLGPPKLTTNPTVLSYMPEDMQRVYSIRFNRNKGKLQVKRVPSTISPYPGESRHSLDLGMSVDVEDVGNREDMTGRSRFSQIIRMPVCRAFFMSMAMLIMVCLTIGIVYILAKK